MENWTDAEMRKYARDDGLRKALDEALKKQCLSLGVEKYYSSRYGYFVEETC
jgi:hypothetical protein